MGRGKDSTGLGPAALHSCSALQRLLLAPLLCPCCAQRYEAGSVALQHCSQMDTSHPLSRRDLHAQLYICNPSARDLAALPLTPALKAALGNSRFAQPRQHPPCCQQSTVQHLQLHRAPTASLCHRCGVTASPAPRGTAMLGCKERGTSLHLTRQKNTLPFPNRGPSLLKAI